MRLPFVFLKSLVLWAAFSIVPAVVAGIFFRKYGFILVFAVFGLFLFIDALRCEIRLREILRPSPIRVGDLDLLAIEDPSSHAFITHPLLSTEPTLWITRGALSLLSPEEIHSMVRGMRSSAKNHGLRFETVLTSWLIRLSSFIPTVFIEIVFFRQKRSKDILIRESVIGVCLTSVLLLMEWFYFAPKVGKARVPEEILRKLEAESRRCVPKLPVALSSHSLVSPWPDSFLTLGRPCLLPLRAVNLGA